MNAFSLLRFAVGGAAAAIVATTIYVASPQIKALISDFGVAIAANPTPSSGDAEADAPATSSLTVAAEFVNLRAEPSQNATIVARLERGTAVIASERRSSRVKVEEARGGSEGSDLRYLVGRPTTP